MPKIRLTHVLSFWEDVHNRKGLLLEEKQIPSLRHPLAEAEVQFKAYV